jgi:hypothetical protein
MEARVRTRNWCKEAGAGTAIHHYSPEALVDPPVPYSVHSTIFINFYSETTVLS